MATSVHEEFFQREVREALQSPNETYQITVASIPLLDDLFHASIVKAAPIISRETFAGSAFRLSTNHTQVQVVGRIKGQYAQELADYVTERKVENGLDDLPEFVDVLDRLCGV